MVSNNELQEVVTSIYFVKIKTTFLQNFLDLNQHQQVLVRSSYALTTELLEIRCEKLFDQSAHDWVQLGVIIFSNILYNKVTKLYLRQGGEGY